MGMKTTFFDTNILIYFLEHDDTYGALASRSFAQAINNGSAAVSVIAAAEYFANKPEVVYIEKYKRLRKLISFVDTTEEVALLAGELRAQYKSIRLPDTLHLATALTSHADVFITNDPQLLKLQKIRDLQIKPLA